MRKGWRIALALAVLWAALPLLIPPEPAMACDCDIPRDAAAAKEKVAAVVKAVVSDIEGAGDFQHVIRLRATESWKGVTEPELAVRPGEGSCAFDFEKGKTYLLYLSRNANGAYSVTNCGRSGEVSGPNPAIAQDLQDLGAGTTFAAAYGEDEGDDPGTRVRRTVGWGGGILVLSAAGLALWMRNSSGRSKAKE